ncbi:transglutaminase-like domain-containing protein [Piscinibacter gummiphilus]|nr:transglutaminase-like domain-containing protein [Piscinibacter gummiphilus]
MRAVNRRTCLRVLPAAFAWVLSPPARAGEAVQRQLRWSFELVNPLSRDLADQAVWLYVPAAETPVQTLDAVRLSVPWTLTRDALGHAVVEVRVPHLPALGRRVVSVTADLTLQDLPRETPLTDPAPWLRGERFIEVDDPAVRALAAGLRRTTPAETARAVYDWVRGHLEYAGYVPEDRGAADALARRRGDCTEYAYLVTALARANGIPARMVGGHDTDRNAVLRAADYHNWAELHFDGRWNLVDAQKERWLRPADQYVAFRIYRDAVLNPVGLAHRYAVRGEMDVRPA